MGKETIIPYVCRCGLQSTQMECALLTALDALVWPIAPTFLLKILRFTSQVRTAVQDTLSPARTLSAPILGTEDKKKKSPNGPEK